MTFPTTTEAILAKLISFDTTSRESNLPLIAWVETYLDHHSVPHLRVDYEIDRKTNLYATIGPDVAGGIVLSGHTDVVPVDGQDWSSDPFVMTLRNGLLYGRGSADMKGFIAVALAMVPQSNAWPSGCRSILHCPATRKSDARVCGHWWNICGTRLEGPRPLSSVNQLPCKL